MTPHDAEKREDLLLDEHRLVLPSGQICLERAGEPGAVPCYFYQLEFSHFPDR